MAMTATTLEALGELFETTIAGLTPRLLYKGGEAWKPYKREVANATTTRRFRLVWSGGGIQERAAVGGGNVEMFAELRVRTDYASSNDKGQFVIEDDFVHLWQELSRLKAPPLNNGVVLVEGIRYEPAPQVDDGLEPPLDSNDVIKIDHVFRVRYMRRIDP